MGGDEEGSVQVAVRMRIYNQREKDAGSTRVVRMTKEMQGSKTFIKNPETDQEKEFKYDYSFNTHSRDEEAECGPYADQNYVFKELGEPVLQGALEGRNSCLFAYGQTGAGKSYSMLGSTTDPEKFGIIPRSCHKIFQVINETKSNPLIQSSVSLQVVEIYCEQINDLLADRKIWPAGGHKPRLTKDGYVVDSVTKGCNNYGEIEEAFQFADKNRSVGSHALNPSSSRAHTIYIIRYEKHTKTSLEATQEEVVACRINLVDLAGSERTESAGTSGQMLKEGNAINLSLTALGNCINALSEGKRPGFRDSKLTLLLQGSMTSGKVFMIAAVSPASICYEETVSTLRFAERIKLVKIKSKLNITIDPVAEIKKEMAEMRAAMQREIDELRAGGATTGGGGGNEEAMAELKALLEEQKANEEALKADMIRQIAEAQKTVAQKQADDDKIRADWIAALGKDAFEKKEDITVPHLLNLNPEDRLAETLSYKLKEGANVAGRRNKEKEPDLEFSGMGMMKEHCVFTWTDDKVTIKNTGAGARSLVNGVELTDKCVVELKHNDRVWLGNNYAFRFVFPGKQGEAHPLPDGVDKPDYFLAEKEITEIHQKKLAASGVEVSALDTKLADALKKIDQANIISGDLNRDCVFQPKIVTNRETQEKQIVVQVVYPFGSLTWPYEKFDVRMIEMVQLWEVWQNCQDNGTTFNLPEPAANPFVDTEHQFIGECDVWLQSLGNMIEVEVDPPILGLNGNKEGSVKVQLVPLDKDGNPGPWDDDKADLDPFVEKPSDLLGREVNFAIKLPLVQFDLDLNAGGRPKYHDVWVRYKLHGGDHDEMFTETAHVAQASINVRLNHSKKFKVTADRDFVNKLEKGRMTFQVWGKIVEDGGTAGARGSSVLPPGWKRVTAYKDPQGVLHENPPSA